jgi:hypothetical protein
MEFSLSCEGLIHPNADLKRIAFENGGLLPLAAVKKKGLHVA